MIGAFFGRLVESRLSELEQQDSAGHAHREEWAERLRGAQLGEELAARNSRTSGLVASADRGHGRPVAAATVPRLLVYQCVVTGVAGLVLLPRTKLLQQTAHLEEEEGAAGPPETGRWQAEGFP